MKYHEMPQNSLSVYRKIIRIIGLLVFLVTIVMVAKEYWEINTSRWKPFQMPRFSRASIVSTKLENNVKKISVKAPQHCLKTKFRNILFVAAFGAMSELESIPLFEVMYKKIFQNRVYCGPDYLNKQSSLENAKFLKQDTRYGAFLYDCLTRVIENHQNYSGYLFIAEDVIMNSRNLHKLDLDLLWESNATIPGPDLYGQIKNTLEWWTSPWGMQAVEKLSEYLVELSYFNNRKTKMTGGQWTPDWDVNQVLNRWLWNGQGKYKTYWSPQTFLYIPQRYSSLYLNLTKHVRASGVRHGIALPTVTRMLELNSQTLKLKTSLINPNNNKRILGNRELFRTMMTENDLIYLEGSRKERRQMLNHLTLKEYGVGEFLQYNNC